MERGVRIGCFIVLTVFLISFVSAEIYINDLESIYNKGDIIDVNIELSSSLSERGFLHAYLVCDSDEIEVYKGIVVMNPNEKKNIEIPIILENSIIGDIIGDCFVRIDFGEGSAQSSIFTVSSGIDLKVNIDKFVYDPNETIAISGRAIKKNGVPLNGSAEIILEGINILVSDFNSENFEFNYDLVDLDNISNEDKLNTSFNISEKNQTDETENNTNNSENNTKIKENIERTLKRIDVGRLFLDVRDGSFSTEFHISENAPGGNYNIEVNVIEKNNLGERINEGKSFSNIKINKIIKKLDIAFNSDSVIPGNSLLYAPLLYDQAGNIVEGDVKISIYKPDKTLIDDRLIKVGKIDSFYVDTNFEQGYWKIVAESGDFKTTKKFFVDNLEKITTFIENNNTLKIKNVGNVPYDGPIKIFIGNDSEIKKIKLDIGEEKKYKLVAPDGKYDVSVSNGDALETLGLTYLTGKAISVDEVKGSLFSGSYMIWVWLIVILILIITIIIILKLIGKKKFIRKSPKIVNIKKNNVNNKQNNSVPYLIDRGSKRSASLISLNVKNLSELQHSNDEKNHLQVIDKALLKAKSYGSKIYIDKNYRIIIFSSIINKNENNDILAIKVAKEIDNELSKDNFIRYGVGVHSGNLIVEKSDRKLKFTSIDNTIHVVKKASDTADNMVLMSEQMHKKTIGKVRVEKTQTPLYWKVKRIMDKESYEEFIKRFLNRQKNLKTD